MLYKIVRPFARITLKVFFRKIHLAHAKRVPANQPVILVANHPAAFMEPCLLSVFQPNDLYFLTKGELFKKAWHAKFLRSLHMVPIYGRADGVDNIKKNASTLSFCHQVLKKNQSVLVMAEGHTVHEKRLRPVQKGTARLAFGTIEKNGPMDLLIIPVGVNYTYAEKFREEVMFDFGEPIQVMDYWADYQKQPGKAIKQLTNLIAKRLRDQIVAIEKTSDDELVEQLLLINRNQDSYSVLPIIVDNKDQLIDEIQIADRVNHMQGENKAMLKLTANDYFENLAKNEITDFAIVQSGYYNFGVTMALVLGFLPFLFGYVLNYLPAWITTKFALAKAKRTEFISSILVSIGLLNFLIYYFILLLVAILVNEKNLWFIVLMIPIWGYFSLIYLELYQKWKEGKAMQNLSEEEIFILKQKRNKVLYDFSNSNSLFDSISI